MKVVLNDKEYSHDAVVFYLLFLFFFQRFAPGRNCTLYLKILTQQLRLFSTLYCRKGDKLCVHVSAATFTVLHLKHPHIRDNLCSSFPKYSGYNALVVSCEL